MKAYELFEKSNTRARFRHIVEFMEAQANILLHPVFGEITEDTDSPPNKRLATKTKFTDSGAAKRSSSFVTTVAAAEACNTKQVPRGQQHRHQRCYGDMSFLSRQTCNSGLPEVQIRIT